MKKLFVSILAVCALIGCQRTSDDVLVKTTEYTYEDYYALAEGRSDSLHISIVMEFPTYMKNAEMLPVVQQTILAEVFGDAYQNMDIKQAIEAFTAMLKTEYKQNNLPALEENLQARGEVLDAIFPEEQIITSMVMNVHDHIMSYAVERYIYMGGAHGSNYRIFYNFDLNTGALIHEADMFNEGYAEPLTELLLQNMVAQNEEIQLIEDLKEYGYNVDEILPNDNFFFTDSCMVYVFNQYEIAPYALGETEIAISFDQLSSLLKPSFEIKAE